MSPRTGGPCPHDVGAIIRRTFQIYVDQASVLMPTAAVVFVISGIFGVLLIAASPGLAFIALIVSLVATTLFTGMVVELVADVQDGKRDASAGQLLRAVTPVLGQLILVGIVAGIGIADRLHPDRRPRPDPRHALVGGGPGRGTRAPRRPARPRAQPRAGARQRLERVRGDPAAGVLVGVVGAGIEAGGRRGGHRRRPRRAGDRRRPHRADLRARGRGPLLRPAPAPTGARPTIPEPDLPSFQSGPFPPAAEWITDHRRGAQSSSWLVAMLWMLLPTGCSGVVWPGERR